MKIVALAGSIIGTNTKTALTKTVEIFSEKYPQHEIKLLDLADYTLQFSDGRNYFEYEGDTKYVTETIMRSEEHTSELQSRGHLVCRLLLEKKKNKKQTKNQMTRTNTKQISTS